MGWGLVDITLLAHTETGLICVIASKIWMCSEARSCVKHTKGHAMGSPSVKTSVLCLHALAANLSSCIPNIFYSYQGRQESLSERPTSLKQH